MSCADRHYLFNEVPGYETSKGEPGIAKAFQKLRSKIEHLEQMRHIEKSYQFQKPCMTDSDITMADIKYEMLLIQLRYMIKLVREYQLENSIISKERSVETTISNNETCIKRPCAETNQTAVSDNIRKKNEAVKNSSIANVKPGPSVENQMSICRSNNLNHYHMKLDDIPFLLGASASASHSVVANVQNIIALMKSHNKALCTSRTNTAADSHNKLLSVDDDQDPNKMLEELTEDLSNLTKKQEKLKVILDNAQSNHSEKSTAKRLLRDRGDSKSKPGCKDMHRTEQEVNKDDESPVVPAVRKIGNTQVRRRFLQSLKDFKLHLSEEDVTWK